MRRYLQTFRNTIIPATLNSYSIIFFFNNRLLASIIILVTFFNLYAGLSGLIATLTAVLIANSMGLDKSQLKKGLYSFNALLTGIGMGTFFDPGWVFLSLLLIAALLTLILSVTFGGWLGKYGLPFLSIPFVITFWFVVLPSSLFENLGLTQRNIYWMNEVYSLGGGTVLNFLQTIDKLPVHNMVNIYLRSMSSIFFQDNLIAGLLVSVALLISSRISFSLSIIGFLSAYFFALFTGSAAASITYYNIGANYIMVSIAIGSFFIIPSRYSYLWSVLLVPLTSLILLFMTTLFGTLHLPVFSMPFSIVVILFVYFLTQRAYPSKLILTPVQFYSPETNLYTYNNNKDRLSRLMNFPLYPPFWGEWTITQGHNGEYTHKGDWGNAFDFMLLDDESKSYASEGLLCEDYYCYNKPVLAPADGIVEEIIDNISDNEIGSVNMAHNWGNTIVIKHLTGLYTQLSHLKKGTFKVSKGDFVRQGDIVANCGNSGRSPVPHIHYQVQATPVIGARTTDYPFAYYILKNENEKPLQEYQKPNQGETISGIIANQLLKNAFSITPNSIFKYSYVNEKGEEKTEQWEAFTDAYNYKYLYCKETESMAYYVNDNSMFHFTAFYGDKKSLLYYLYLTAYKVFLGNTDSFEIKEAMPLNIIQDKKISLWFQDFIAPFYTYFSVWFSITSESHENILATHEIVLNTKTEVTLFKKTETIGKGTITLFDNSIQAFTYETNKSKITARCINS